jgi:signal transduction histidine kinase
VSGPSPREFLQRLPLFECLGEDDLDRLAEQTETVELSAGMTLMAEGSPSDALYVVVDGVLEAAQRSAGRDVFLANIGIGELLGEISLLDGSPRTATVRAVGDVRVLRIGEAAARALLENPKAVRMMLRSMAARLRNSQALLRQTEKMAALGTLSAGLTHELNNPAAAVRRAAERALELATRLGEDDGSPRAPGDDLDDDPLARADREDAVAELLTEAGVDAPWVVAPDLVAAGWDRPALAAWLGAVPPGEQSERLLHLWLHTALRVTVAEAAEAAGRISDIVGAVKEYSHLDRGGAEDVDVNRGLDSTLRLLAHKSRGVDVVRDFDQALPPTSGHAGELNQVWTNLLDNAFDALGAPEGKGTVTIRTRRERDGVLVAIADSGPGIPAEIRERVFEPFFTTKPVGSGTGLGLHIAHHIVVGGHRGTIDVVSGPQGTTFSVWLPAAS